MIGEDKRRKNSLLIISKAFTANEIIKRALKIGENIITNLVTHPIFKSLESKKAS